MEVLFPFQIFLIPSMLLSKETLDNLKINIYYLFQFNYLNFICDKSPVVHHFGVVNGFKYYNTHEIWPLLLWRRRGREFKMLHC